MPGGECVGEQREESRTESIRKFWALAASVITREVGILVSSRSLQGEYKGHFVQDSEHPDCLHESWSFPQKGLTSLREAPRGLLTTAPFPWKNENHQGDKFPTGPSSMVLQVEPPLCLHQEQEERESQ